MNTERARQLYTRWESDETNRVALRAFLESQNGELFQNLMHSWQSPTDLPDLIPGIDPAKLEASRYDQTVGWNRCLDTIRQLAYGAPAPAEEPKPWANYGMDNEENN